MQRVTRIGTHLVCAAAAAVLALAGCSAEPPVGPPPPAAGHAGHGGHAPGGDGRVVLFAVQTGPLGNVATEGEGHLLYRFDGDAAQPPTSNCVGVCTETWHPLVIVDGAQPELAGISRAAIGTMTRADGGLQLTLAGWPLYVHRDDDGNLRTAGAHGTDGQWFAVTPTGDRATAR